MKTNEVLKLLRITRPALTKYVKEGLIKVEKMPNGRYEYDSETVYAFLNKDIKRKNFLLLHYLMPNDTKNNGFTDDRRTKTNRPDKRSYGLGLSIVKSIFELHGIKCEMSMKGSVLKCYADFS